MPQGSITYTAKRSLVSSHVAERVYTVDVEIIDATPSVSDVKATDRSQGGATETTFFRQDRSWRITIAPMRGSDLALVREFLDSTESGQNFSVDVYGDESYPLVLKRVETGHSEDPFMRVGSAEGDWFQASFTALQALISDTSHAGNVGWGVGGGGGGGGGAGGGALGSIDIYSLNVGGSSGGLDPPPPPEGVTLYSDWSAPAVINTSGHYAPGTDAISQGKPNPYVVVIGHCIGAINPVFTYGGTSAVASSGSSGVWMYIFDLTANPPSNDLIEAVDQSTYSALVVYGVADLAVHTNQAFPAAPCTDSWTGIGAGSMLVGVAMSTHNSSLSVASSDGASLGQVTEPDSPFNDGQVIGVHQLPTAINVTLTWDTDGFVLRNATSAVFSGG